MCSVGVWCVCVCVCERESVLVGCVCGVWESVCVVCGC